MNYEQALRRVDELEAILKQREAHDSPAVVTGTGNARSVFRSVMDHSELFEAERENARQRAQLDRAGLRENVEQLKELVAIGAENERLKARLAENTALLEEARKTIDELRVALKWQNMKGGE